jgi:hypothetical protein
MDNMVYRQSAIENRAIENIGESAIGIERCPMIDGSSIADHRSSIAVIYI